MNLPKRHHYVPELLLKRFVDDAGWLHHYDKRRHDLGVRRSRPRELFFENHLYSEIDASGAKDPSLEHELARIEAIAEPLIERIVASARIGETPGVSIRELEAWAHFFQLQWKRVPDTRHRTVSPTEALDMINETLRDARRLFPNRAAEVDELSTPEAKARIIRNARIGSLRHRSREAISILLQRGLAILRITHPRKQFITGSSPVVKLTIQGRSNLADPRVEMWMPLAPDVAIGVGTGGEKLLTLDKGAPVRLLNSAIAETGVAIAGASSALISSLANPR